MRWIDADAVLPKLTVMADAAEQSSLTSAAEGVGGEVAREAMRAICGTLRAIINIIGEAPVGDVVDIKPLCDWLAGYAAPPVKLPIERPWEREALTRGWEYAVREFVVKQENEGMREATDEEVGHTKMHGW